VLAFSIVDSDHPASTGTLQCSRRENQGVSDAQTAKESLTVSADHRCRIAIDKANDRADIAGALETRPDVIAHCIGLHAYLGRKRTTEMTIPPPADYWAPAATNVITRELLEPRRAGRMLAVEKALWTALGAPVIETV
jgi:hypothetical protein